jgi:hypothetical protein
VVYWQQQDSFEEEDRFMKDITASYVIKVLCLCCHGDSITLKRRRRRSLPFLLPPPPVWNTIVLRHHLDVRQYTCSFQEGLQQLVDGAPGVTPVRAIFLGVRRDDPHGSTLTLTCHFW